MTDNTNQPASFRSLFVAGAAGPYRSNVAGNVHSHGPPGTNCSQTAPSSVVYELDGDLTNDYHVYALDWREQWLAYYVDGTLVGNFTGSQ